MRAATWNQAIPESLSSGACKTLYSSLRQPTRHQHCHINSYTQNHVHLQNKHWEHVSCFGWSEYLTHLKQRNQPTIIYKSFINQAVNRSRSNKNKRFAQKHTDVSTNSIRIFCIHSLEADFLCSSSAKPATRTGCFREQRCYLCVCDLTARLTVGVKPSTNEKEK